LPSPPPPTPIALNSLSTYPIFRLESGTSGFQLNGASTPVSSDVLSGFLHELLVTSSETKADKIQT
jgi:hypothetical protein